jgi:hypothetical protein
LQELIARPGGHGNAVGVAHLAVGGDARGGDPDVVVAVIVGIRDQPVGPVEGHPRPALRAQERGHQERELIDDAAIERDPRAEDVRIRPPDQEVIRRAGRDADPRPIPLHAHRHVELDLGPDSRRGRPERARTWRRRLRGALRLARGGAREQIQPEGNDRHSPRR